MPIESWKLETEKLPDSGIYFLLMYSEDAHIQIGSLGVVHFSPGYYIYIGSAQRNLRKRIERHLSPYKKLRWHIDYFLQHARILGVRAAELGKEWEERTALALSKGYRYIKGFGCSDTHAPSHLFYSSDLRIIEFVENLLTQAMNEELK